MRFMKDENGNGLLAMPMNVYKDKLSDLSMEQQTAVKMHVQKFLKVIEN